MARPVVSSGKLKRRRRNRKLLIIGGSALAFVLAVAGLAWLSHASFLRVTDIEVSGLSSLPPQELISFARERMQGNYLSLFAKDDIFLYPRAAIAAALARQYPTLRQIDVHARDFHTVELVAAERQPAALWCPSSPDSSGSSTQGGACSYLDEQGLIYAPAPSFSDDPYVSYSGPTATTTGPGLRQYLSQDEFQSLAALVAAIAGKEPSDPISQVAVDDSLDARAYFRDDFVLVWSLKDDGGDVFERFNLALDSDAFKGKPLGDFEYLDLRFGDKLYYKAKTASD